MSETTGWCVFEGLDLSKLGQLPCKSSPTRAITTLFNEIRPTAVVAENYKVYSWKANQHANQELFTPKLLGMINLLCAQRHIPLALQMAVQAKGFCTNEKLQAWGFYKRRQRHSNDAIRHAAYYLLFNKGR